MRSIATGLQGADAAVERVVEEPEQQQQRRDQDRHPAHHRRLHERALPAVGEEEHEHEQDRGAQEEDNPQRRRNHALTAVRAVGASILALGTLVEVLRERRLLGRGARLGPPEAAEHGHAPRVQRRRRASPTPSAAIPGARRFARNTRAPPRARSRAGDGRNCTVSNCWATMRASASAPLRDVS